MSQPKRLGALAKFKAGHKSILVATDVASRGLDIPNVDLVLNYDIPSHGKDYIHRYFCFFVYAHRVAVVSVLEWFLFLCLEWDELRALAELDDRWPL